MFFPNLTHRRRQHELMDEPDVDPNHLDRSLRFLRLVNRVLGYTRQLLDRLDAYSKNWKPTDTIRIVDIGTGSADMPVAILKWADARGFNVRCTGVDLHAKTTRVARDASNDARLTIVQADALNLPFHDGAFDYAVTSTFLHHLDTADVVKVIADMGRVASRGVVIADLIRSRLAYAGIRVLSCFANPIVRHDGPASICQAFTKAEVLSMRDQAGLTYTQYRQHLCGRFVLAGEKPM
jgi:ubiquinone/menaquinone biosynthesis C-methylase UbiE